MRQFFQSPNWTLQDGQMVLRGDSNPDVRILLAPGIKIRTRYLTVTKDTGILLHEPTTDREIAINRIKRSRLNEYVDRINWECPQIMGRFNLEKIGENRFVARPTDQIDHTIFACISICSNQVATDKLVTDATILATTKLTSGSIGPRSEFLIVFKPGNRFLARYRVHNNKMAKIFNAMDPRKLSHTIEYHWDGHKIADVNIRTQEYAQYHETRR